MQNFILKGIFAAQNYKILNLAKTNIQCVSKLHNDFKMTNSADSTTTSLLKFYSTEKKIEDQPTELETKYQTLNKTIINPYTIFVKNNYRDLSAQHTGTSAEIIKAIAEKWRSMPYEEKIVYFETADKNRKEKQEGLQKLFKAFSLREVHSLRNKLKATKGERIKKLSLQRIKKEQHLLNRPKRPLTGFMRFLNTLERGEATLQEFAKGGGERWKMMPEQEKEKYNEESKEEFVKFSQDLKEWETRMIAEGKNKLVRKSFRMTIKNSLNKDDLRMAKLREKALRAKQKLERKKNKIIKEMTNSRKIKEGEKLREKKLEELKSENDAGNQETKENEAFIIKDENEKTKQ